MNPVTMEVSHSYPNVMGTMQQFLFYNKGGAAVMQTCTAVCRSGYNAHSHHKNHLATITLRFRAGDARRYPLLYPLPIKELRLHFSAFRGACPHQIYEATYYAGNLLRLEWFELRFDQFPHIALKNLSKFCFRYLMLCYGSLCNHGLPSI